MSKRLHALLQRLAGLFRQVLPAVELRDSFVFGGLAMVGYGLHAIYPPASWIVVGAVLFIMGVRA